VSITEEKYGKDILIAFTEDGTEFTGTRDGKVFCSFQSTQGPVGIHGGNFRVSSGERRNFVLGVVSIVIILQEDALVGSQTKGIGIKFEDTGQKPRKKNEEKSADTKATTPTLSPKSASGKLEAAGGDIPSSNKKGSQQIVVNSSSRSKKIPRKAATHSGPRGSSSEKVSSPRKTESHDRKSPKLVQASSEKKTPNEKRASNENKTSEERGSHPLSRKKSDHSMKNHKHSSESSTLENSSTGNKTGNGKTDGNIPQILPTLVPKFGNTEDLKMPSLQPIFSTSSVPYSFSGISRSPTKAPTAESYVKVWEQWEAIAALDENNT